MRESAPFLCFISPGNMDASFGSPKGAGEPRARRLRLSVPGRQQEEAKCFQGGGWGVRLPQDTSKPWQGARGQAGVCVGAHEPTVRASGWWRTQHPPQELAQVGGPTERRTAPASASQQHLLMDDGEVAQRSTGRGLVKTAAAHPQSRTLTRWNTFIPEGQLTTEQTFANMVYGQQDIVLRYHTALCAFRSAGCHDDVHSPVHLQVRVWHVPRCHTQPSCAEARMQ